MQPFVKRNSPFYGAFPILWGLQCQRPKANKKRFFISDVRWIPRSMELGRSKTKSHEGDKLWSVDFPSAKAAMYWKNAVNWNILVTVGKKINRDSGSSGERTWKGLFFVLPEKLEESAALWVKVPYEEWTRKTMSTKGLILWEDGGTALQAYILP